MENASEAMMMAFGVLIFVLALTVAINSFSQARETAEIVLYSSDVTNLYEYDEYDEATIGASQSRIVGLETIIPTLYGYKNENYTVLFREGKGYNKDTGKFAETSIMKLYSTPTNRSWQIGRSHPNEDEKKVYADKIKERYSKFFTNFNYANAYTIFSFDIDEETDRSEPFAANNEKNKENIDCFLYGKTFKKIDGTNEDYIVYNNFIQNNWNYKFVENVAEIDFQKEVYDVDSNNEEIKVETPMTSKNKKTVYIFTKIISEV